MASIWSGHQKKKKKNTKKCTQKQPATKQNCVRLQNLERNLNIFTKINNNKTDAAGIKNRRNFWEAFDIGKSTLSVNQ